MPERLTPKRGHQKNEQPHQQPACTSARIASKTRKKGRVSRTATTYDRTATAKAQHRTEMPKPASFIGPTSSRSKQNGRRQAQIQNITGSYPTDARNEKT